MSVARAPARRRAHAGALGAGATDVGVIEQDARGHGPARAGPRRRRRTRRRRAACGRRSPAPPAAGAGAPSARPGAARPTSAPSPSTRARGGRPGRLDEGTGSTRCTVPPTQDRTSAPWASRNSPKSVRTMDEKRSARLAHGGLLVPQQHRVEGARQRAEAHRQDGCEGEPEAPGDATAREADAVRRARGPAADAADPRARRRDAEGVRRRRRAPGRGRGRVDTGERSRWPG